MSLATILSAAISLLTAIPGAYNSLKALYTDIQNHNALTDAEKADLLTKAKAAIDAADERLQSLSLADPKPSAPSDITS